MPAENIFLLDFGFLSGDKGWFLPGASGGAMTDKNRNPEREWINIPVSGAVVTHKDGNVLFDTGVSPNILKAISPGDEVDFPVTSLSEDNKIENQLLKIGMRPEDISFVVFSHLHFDHVGQALPFKETRAPFIVQKRELQSALAQIWQGLGGYALSDLEPLVGANWTLLDENSFELLDGITIEFTGGHTSGHQVMHVETRAGNNYTLTGDFFHIRQEYETETKGWLLSDADEWHSFLGKLKLRERTRNSKIIMGHDPSLWQEFPKAPESIE